MRREEATFADRTALGSWVLQVALCGSVLAEVGGPQLQHRLGPPSSQNFSPALTRWFSCLIVLSTAVLLIGSPSRT
jgi:hypothetical protein